MAYFKNAIVCKKHNHSALKAYCGVDALADMYFYGVFPFDKHNHENGGNKLFEKLITLCDMRSKYGTTCEVRQDGTTLSSMSILMLQWVPQVLKLFRLLTIFLILPANSW